MKIIKKRMFDLCLETGDPGTTDVHLAGFGYVQKTCARGKNRVGYIKKVRK